VTLYRMAIPLLKKFGSVQCSVFSIHDCCHVKKYVIDQFWLLYTTSSKIICHDINLVDGDFSSTRIYVRARKNINFRPLLCIGTCIAIHNFYVFRSAPLSTSTE